LDNDRCVVEIDVLLDAWKSFLSADSDELHLRKRLTATLRRLEELKFVKLFQTEPDAWEVRKLLKARLPLEELENLRSRMLAAERGGVNGQGSAQAS
jgi:Domain of unknown function (DUF4194)